MKILISITNLEVGGAQLFAINYANYLSEKHEVYIYEHRPEDRVKDFIQEHLNKRIKLISFSQSHFILKVIWKLNKLIKKTAAEKQQYEQTAEEHLGPGHLTTGTIHGDVKSMTCHAPGCDRYPCHHCTIEFKDMEIALQAGFTPCDTCKAILKKQSSLAADKALLP